MSATSSSTCIVSAPHVVSWQQNAAPGTAQKISLGWISRHTCQAAAACDAVVDPAAWFREDMHTFRTDAQPWIKHSQHLTLMCLCTALPLLLLLLLLLLTVMALANNNCPTT
jgi:hypothetical protein